jgi:hypothetical protein
MSLPAGVETVTVTSGTPLIRFDGAFKQGSLVFTGPDLVTIGEDDVITGGGVEVPLVDGEFTVTLCATDATGMSPTGWTYKVASRFTNATNWIRHITLPKGASPVKLADILVPDAVAGTYTVLKDPSYIGNVLVSGTPTVGQVLVATSATTASWQTPSSGSGSATRTASVHVIDDNLSGLPSAASWTIVQTSGGTKLQCSITAAVGDRIQIVGDFMHVGSHFLDWASLLSTGVIDQYMGSGAGTPLSEGEPSMYPSLTFEYVTNPPQFTVTSGQIDGNGKVTAALVHQGTGSGIVYAHSTYPFDLRLENTGPEPA